MEFGGRELGGYTLGKILGKGKFGKVRIAYKLVSEQKNGYEVKRRETYAMKVIMKDQVENTGDLSRIRRETKILTTLSHPHIIRCYDVFETEKEICIVTEYADGGDLYNYIASTNEGYLSLNESCRLFRQMVTAIRYCHTHQVVHRDLKPENIFLDKDKNVKIGDFGFSRVFKFESGLSTPCGSLAYVAPEVISGKDYIGPTADVWSLGCIFYVMIVGRLPFDALTNPEIVDRIRRGNFHDNPNLTEKTKKFLRRVLYPNPSRRYRIPEIAIHSAVWEDKTMLQKVLRPFALKLAYSKPYHQSAIMGLTLQRSFSESQLKTILSDFRENKGSNNFLATSLQKEVPKPMEVEEDPFMPKDNFSFPRLSKLDNPEYYTNYYDSILKQNRPQLPSLDFSQIHNNNNNNSSDNMEEDTYRTENYLDEKGVFVPRIANKLNSSGSPTTLRLVALRRSQLQHPSGLSKQADVQSSARPSLSRSTSSGNLQ